MRILLAVLLLFASSLSANAHAILTDSTPTPGATLTPGPQRMVLRYNSRIDASRSRITLLGSPPTNLPIVPIAAAELTVTAVLAPGKQTLRWQVLAVDGHVTRGDLSFFVAAP